LRSNKTLNIYIWFAFLFYVISFFGGGGVRFREAIPWYVLISRDVVWLGLIAYLGYCVKWANLRNQLRESDYGEFLKTFFFLCCLYLVIVLTHLIHRDLQEIVQHDLRNILLYSLILPFLPFVFQTKKDIHTLTDTFLKLGVFLSLFGIATRYIRPDFLTWDGRIVSTMSDPNNLGIFLSFCMLLVVANREVLERRKAIAYFLIYSLALVLTSSITALLTVNFGVFITLAVQKGWLKAFILSLAIFYMLICFSFAVKLAENPGMSSANLLKRPYHTEKYLVDRLEKFSRGKFSRLFLRGFLPSVQKFHSVRSVRYKRAQFMTMFTGNVAGIKELRGIKKVVTLLGNFELRKYATLDNQYFNFIVNTGIISAIIFFGIFVWGGITGIKTYLFLKDTDKDLAAFLLPFPVFLLSMALVAFNGAAFLNRFPLNFLIWLSFGIIFVVKTFLNSSKI